MNYIPQEIERKILMDYDDDYKHMFICKGWFNVIKEKYNIKKKLATTLWNKIDNFKKNLNDKYIVITTWNTCNDAARIGLDRFKDYKLNYLIQNIVYNIPIHIIFNKGRYDGGWDYNDYLHFKILKKNVKEILNKVKKYKVKLHAKSQTDVIYEINESSRFDFFEFIIW